MTQFTKPTFTVSQRGRDPATCSHGWITEQGVCVFCGTQVPDTVLRDALALDDALRADVDGWMQQEEDAALRRAKGEP